MKLIAGLRLGFVAACAALLAHTPSALAEPLTVVRGVTQLPTSGLVLDLPAKAGVEYHVSGSWQLTAEGVFDTRDVVDEFDVATNTLVAGNWILAGYFTAGGCEKTLATTALDAAWTQSATLWGQTWSVRGGIFKFDNSLGRRPAAMLCRETDTGHTLLLYRFLTTQPDTTGQAAIMEDVRGAKVLAAAAKAYSESRTADIFPTRRPEVTIRGQSKAARTVTLPISKMEIAIPDDGYVWLVREGDGIDNLDRLLPTLPELSMEIVYADDYFCDEMFETITLPTRDGHKPVNLPTGWQAGPAIDVDGEVELAMCYETEFGALMVGVFQGPDTTDVGSLNAILTALAVGADG